MAGQMGLLRGEIDISHLRQIGPVAPELNVDHGIGVYEVNKYCFADPLVGYRFTLLECNGILVTVGDTEEGFVDCIVRYESTDVCECACINAGFLPQFPLGAGRRIFAFQGGAASGGFKVSAVVWLPGIPLHQQIITVYVPD